MPSPVGHIAVGMAAARLHLWRRPFSRQDIALAAALYSALSLAPDLDVLAFSFGVPYSAPFGHRGAAHSLTVALAVGLLAILVGLIAGTGAARTGLGAFFVTGSHGLLDTLTSGGLGIALLWPLSHRRYFAPWRPIPVSPIGYGFLSRQGLFIAVIELLYFSPLYVFALWPR